MLSVRHCPHTGVVNYFAAADPFMAIGSIVRAGSQTCHWRCYVGQPSASGVAPDMRTAERRLVGIYRQSLRAAVSARRGRDGANRRGRRLHAAALANP
jgi:hypothetical protein